VAPQRDRIGTRHPTLKPAANLAKPHQQLIQRLWHIVIVPIVEGDEVGDCHGIPFLEPLNLRRRII
jgi:hypothetical protein